VFNIGPTELVIILIIALIVFGPRRLPEVGRTIGRSLRELRRASSDLRDELERNLSLEEDEPPRPPASRPSQGPQRPPTAGWPAGSGERPPTAGSSSGPGERPPTAGPSSGPGERPPAGREVGPGEAAGGP
jgi:sec-independent protein translocase protein TatA